MGPKARLGGVKEGFFNLAYQPGMALKVKRLPMPAAAKQARILMTSLITALNSIRGLSDLNIPQLYSI